jgi:hypothetical protein
MSKQPNGFCVRATRFWRKNIFMAGNGVPQDNIEAFKWLELAFFSLPAGGPRSDVARAMTDVAEHMTREQIAEAKQRERGWKAKPEVK